MRQLTHSGRPGRRAAPLLRRGAAPGL